MNTLRRQIIFFLLFTSYLVATISWDKDIYNTVTGIDNTTTYSYDLSIPFDTESFTGSLSKFHSSSSIEWCYDALIKPENAPGSWIWRNADTTWLYNYQTQSWSTVGSEVKWHKSSSWVTPHSVDHYQAWENRATVDAWSLSPTATDWGTVPANSPGCITFQNHM